jgi:hypothetical protein
VDFTRKNPKSSPDFVFGTHKAFDGSGRDAKTVVKTIIALGRELNMRVTVEGVETAKQAAFLDKADGDQAQGCFFGRPVPAAEVGAQILANFQKTPQRRRPQQPQRRNCASSSHRQNDSAAETRSGSLSIGGGASRSACGCRLNRSMQHRR